MTVKIKTTKVFKEILKAFEGKKRRALLEGGTSSSKTYSAIQFLILLAQEASSPILISIVSETLPHLKKGAIKDFFDIMDEQPDSCPFWSRTDFTYARPEWQGKLEFFGADNKDKVRGPRRHVLFINEGNNIPWEAARGLDIRTSVFTIVDWNPVGEYWVHEYESSPGVKVPGWIHDKENAYSHSTYQDARKFLLPSVVENIESYRDKDPNWWKIYGLGLLGKIKGLVHPDFDQVDALPKGDYFYGLDFGYSDDPAVLVKNVIVNDALYSQELFYETGLTNDQICRRMDLLGIRKNYDEIFADSAEPKSIEEIYQEKFNIKPCEKGKGSVEYGIQKVNQYRQFWTKDSVNCINEQRNYRYVEDKEGRLTEKTTHKWSHGMDARRYAVSSKIIRLRDNRPIPVISPRG